MALKKQTSKSNKVEQAMTYLMAMDEEKLIEFFPLLNRDMFADPRNYTVIEAAARLYKDQAFTLRNLEEELRTKHEIAQAQALLTTLSASLTRASSFEKHYSVWVERGRKRYISVREAQLDDTDLEIDTFIDRRRAILEEAMQLGSVDVGTSMGEAVDRSIEIMEHYRSTKGMDVIRTGFKALDDAFIGMMPSDVVVLAARPNRGKTTLAVQWARAAQALGGVYFNTFEMPPEQLAPLIGAQQNSVNSFTFRQPWLLSDEEFEKAKRLLASLREMGIRFGNVQSPARMASIIARLRPKLAIVDHIQRLRTPPEFRNNTHNFLGDVMKQYVDCASKYSLPLLVLSQLNREGADCPTIEDLKSSGGIEEDADTVLILHAPNFGDPGPDGLKAELILAKSRFGFVGQKAELLFDKTTQTFLPWDPVRAVKIVENLHQWTHGSR